MREDFRIRLRRLFRSEAPSRTIFFLKKKFRLLFRKFLIFVRNRLSLAPIFGPGVLETDRELALPYSWFFQARALAHGKDVSLGPFPDALEIRVRILPRAEGSLLKARARLRFAFLKRFYPDRPERELDALAHRLILSALLLGPPRIGRKAPDRDIPVRENFPSLMFKTRSPSFREKIQEWGRPAKPRGLISAQRLLFYPLRIAYGDLRELLPPPFLAPAQEDLFLQMVLAPEDGERVRLLLLAPALAVPPGNIGGGGLVLYEESSATRVYPGLRRYEFLPNKLRFSGLDGEGRKIMELSLFPERVIDSRDALPFPLEAGQALYFQDPETLNIRIQEGVSQFAVNRLYVMRKIGPGDRSLDPAAYFSKRLGCRLESPEYSYFLSRLDRRVARERELKFRWMNYRSYPATEIQIAAGTYGARTFD